LLLTLIAGVAAVLALVYATATIDTSTEAVPERGGAYTEGVAGTPQRINPLLITNQAEGDLAALIFSGLVRLGPRGDIQPDLAERWTISPDGREYTFNLRRNLFWHDGVPLEARDVLFTVELIQDEDYEGDQRLAEVFSAVTVEAPDDSTVVMTLEEPFAPFLSYATFGILPQHLLSGRSVTAIMDAPFNQSPVGSGPFELRRLEADRAVLQSFDLYHLGAPLLDEFIVRFYRDDATLLNALLNGAVDGALLQSPLTPDDIALIDDDATWVRRGLHSTRFSLVYLNQSLEAFRDENVRRALQVGLSREEIIQSVFAGQAIPVDAPIVPDIWAYDASPEAYAFDADRATSLLEEAGWRLQPGGVREQDGEPLEFTLSTVEGSSAGKRTPGRAAAISRGSAWT
jgi:peptide/nickel transport system substrate-binding protein